MQFNRFIQIMIGDTSSSAQLIGLSPEMRVSFQCTKNDKDESNKLLVDVYNLSSSTRAKIEKKGSKMVLKAGYSNDFIEVLAIADIANYETIKNGPDIITRISAGDGLSAIKNSKISLSYNKNVTVNQLLSDISDKMDLDFFEITPTANGSYKNGFSYSGRPKDALNKITKRFNLSWSIQNNGLIILNSEEARQGQSVLLNASTGMINIPTRWDDSGTETKEINGGIKVVSRLNPRIEPRSKITIESSTTTLSGNYIVETVTHSGDNRGEEFFSTIEARKV